MTIDSNVELGNETIAPPAVHEDKPLEVKALKPITFPGLEEFQNNPVLFHEKLTARYNSMNIAALDAHFHKVQQQLLAAGPDLEKQRAANTFEDMQLAMMHQLKKGAKRLTEHKEEEAKEKPPTAKAKKAAVAAKNMDDALFD